MRANHGTIKTEQRKVRRAAAQAAEAQAHAMTYNRAALSLIAIYAAGYSAVSVLDADFSVSCVLSIAIMSALVLVASCIKTIPALAFSVAQIVAMSITALLLVAYLHADQTLYSQAVAVYNSANETLLLLDAALLVLIP